MSVYDTITQTIVAALESVKPGDFKMPWHTDKAGIFPTNAVSNKPYRGINILALLATAEDKGYDSGLWATFKQWKDLGATVKKGEKSATVVLWKTTKKEGQEDETEERHETFFARAFHVFNVAQVEGYEVPAAPVRSANERIERAEAFFANTKAEIRTGGGMAYYSPAKDFVQMPSLEVFNDSISYYSVLAHEVTHWAGASTRLDRELKNRFGSEAYAAEELIAELGAAFLCAELELANEPRADHAQYIASWIKVLKDDSKAIFTAASKAQQAADYLKAFQKDEQRAAA